MTKLDQARCNFASTPASQLRSLLIMGLVLGLLATVGLGIVLPRTAVGQDFSPEHPKVKTMVAKGIDYLSSLPAPSISYDGGAELLIAYTIYKSTGDLEHPKVKAGLTLATKMARGLYQSTTRGESKIVYAVSLACCFWPMPMPLSIALSLIWSWIGCCRYKRIMVGSAI
ncbi:MAG: hypothetical protein R3C56_31660 [Pirellulaceae bacterium]